MLFRLETNTPRFEVFRRLNEELLFFLEKSVEQTTFSRRLFTEGEIGSACWANTRVNNARAKSDLTRDKFQKLHVALNQTSEATRRQLFETARDNQDMSAFFTTPNRTLLFFLPSETFERLKQLASHLYCYTKDLQGIIDACGVSINQHFSSFKTINGKVCKACGMRPLSAVRANIPEEEQWRADYDHQLCKSKYPLFSVHPDNLIPLCDVCNQDAKKAKDLFFCESSGGRRFFYPFEESAAQHVKIEIEALDDPEPHVSLQWSTSDEDILEKLTSWDEVYEIKNLVEGGLRPFDTFITDEINPMGLSHFVNQVNNKARPLSQGTETRKEWSFWHQKLFSRLSEIDLSPFWEKSKFIAQQGEDGSNYILDR